MAKLTRPKHKRADGVATQERVIVVATSMFAAGGYEATSLRQISAAAEIDIATLKYHFHDKPSLFAEVYRRGHQKFLDAIEPILAELDAVESKAELRGVVDDFVVIMHDFVDEHLDFVKIVLFRMLEESVDVIGLEDELQSIAIATLVERFKRLADKGITKPLDERALVVFLVSSFSMWQVTGRFKENWFGSPGLNSEAGRARSEEFFITMVERTIGIEASE